MSQPEKPVAVPVAARERVRVFDTTLRDGEQAPGFSMSRAQKLRVAHALAELGVDVIEAGFPQASDGDFDAVRAVATEVRGPTICGLAGAQFGDIEAVARATENAAHARIHIFLATSPIHRRHKLNMSREQVLDVGAKAVRRARELCDDVEFSAEDAIRTEPEYLIEVLSTMIEAGATIPRNKAVVGENAFAHESGIHQHGMLKHRETYEIMRPEDVGFSRTQLVLGKHSGRHALRERLTNLGHEFDDAQLDEVFTRFKTLADKKREVFDSDLDALALGLDPEALGPWRLQHLHATTHLGNGASASVKLKHSDGRVAAE